MYTAGGFEFDRTIGRAVYRNVGCFVPILNALNSAVAMVINNERKCPSKSREFVSDFYCQ